MINAFLIGQPLNHHSRVNPQPKAAVRLDNASIRAGSTLKLFAANLVLSGLHIALASPVTVLSWQVFYHGQEDLSRMQQTPNPLPNVDAHIIALV